MAKHYKKITKDYDDEERDIKQTVKRKKTGPKKQAILKENKVIT